MIAVLQIRIGIVLLSVTIVIYVLLGAFRIDVTQRIDEKKNLWLSNQNITAIRREFYQYLASRLRDTPYPGVENFTSYVIAQSGLQPLFGARPLRPDFGPILNDVTFYRYPIGIQSCRHRSSSNNSSSLFVAIISAPNYFQKRNIIRQTWLRDLKMQTNAESANFAGYAFIIGLPKSDKIQKQIENEDATYHDVLQIEMIDHYYNLTVKVVGLLNWMNDRCSHIDFFLKVDDDVYVNTKNLLTIIKSLNSSEQSIYGSLVYSPPQREGKWNISWEDWPWSNYPMYFSGASILMPYCAVTPLLAAAQTTPYLPFDDTFLTGLCTSKAGIKIRDSDRFFVGLMEENSDPCEVYTAITWLTESVEHFNRSHWATMNFYENLTQCILEEPDDTKRTADPMEDIFFSFSP